MLLVDAANVVGSQPDGWWRDRPGAARKLVTRLREATSEGRLAGPLVVVLEGAARPGAATGARDGVRVVHSPGSGDETLLAEIRAAAEPVVPVTADRALRTRAAALGAEVVGPTWLLDRLSAD